MKKTALILLLVTAVLVTAFPASAVFERIDYFKTVEVFERTEPLISSEMFETIREDAKQDLANGKVFKAIDPFTKKEVPTAKEEATKPAEDTSKKDDIIEIFVDLPESNASHVNILSFLKGYSYF